MLVDAQWPHPRRRPGRGPTPPWPILMVALLAAGYLLPALLAYLCLLGALYCAVETLTMFLPRDGMRHHKQ